MRPGRLDRLLYVGVAEDAASKAKVLAALTRKCAPAPHATSHSLVAHGPAAKETYASSPARDGQILQEAATRPHRHWGNS